jgi:hypothetical protein
VAYTDVEYTRKKMKDTLLMGPTPKLGGRRAEFKFGKQPDYLADAKRRIRKWAKEETARKAREQEALDAQFENADWRL